MELLSAALNPKSRILNVWTGNEFFLVFTPRPVVQLQFCTGRVLDLLFCRTSVFTQSVSACWLNPFFTSQTDRCLCDWPDLNLFTLQRLTETVGAGSCCQHVSRTCRPYKQHKALLISLIQELCGLKPTAVVFTDSAERLEPGVPTHLSRCRWYWQLRVPLGA